MKRTPCPIEQLKDLITNGIVLEIFEAEQTLALDELIGINAKVINEQRFGSLFRSLQIILGKCFSLAIARLYERPKPKYHIKSIPMALKLLQDNADELPIKKKRRPFIVGMLAELGYDMEQLQLMSDQEITLKITKYFLNHIQSKEMQDALKALKKVRDKAIAHSEAIELSELQLPTYAKIGQLVDMAKKFVVVIGNGYLGMNYEANGKYLHTSGAKRASRSLSRLLIKAGILEDDEKGEKMKEFRITDKTRNNVGNIFISIWGYWLDKDEWHCPHCNKVKKTKNLISVNTIRVREELDLILNLGKIKIEVDIELECGDNPITLEGEHYI